jgi:hypothetical protein
MSVAAGRPRLLLAKLLSSVHRLSGGRLTARRSTLAPGSSAAWGLELRCRTGEAVAVVEADVARHSLEQRQLTLGTETPSYRRSSSPGFPT